MKVLFIWPDLGESTHRVNLGIAYISSVLKEHGHKTSLLYLTQRMSKQHFLRIIKAESPDLIGFSSTTIQHHHVHEFASWIKETLDIPIISGGVHSTLAPEEVISDRNINMVCVGEGEFPMLEVLETLEAGKEPDNVKNLWVRTKDDRCIRNPVRPPIEDLDALPFPDREIFDYARLLKRNSYTAYFMATRGCPFQCAYCCSPLLSRMGGGKLVRFRSVDNVIDEMKQVVSRYKVKRIYLDDDVFTINRKWVEEFCDKYREEVGLPFGANARVDTVNREVLRKMKEAGCRFLAFGVESGNEWLRRNVLNRRITNKQIKTAFQLCHELGIRTRAFNMIGFPYETPKMVEDTIRLNREIRPTFIQVSVFYPFPGTRLYDTCREEGLFSDKTLESYFERESVLNLQHLTNQQIAKYFNELKFMAIRGQVREHSGYAWFIYSVLLSVLKNEDRVRNIVLKLNNVRRHIVGKAVEGW